jgi:hypothetical protein
MTGPITGLEVRGAEEPESAVLMSELEQTIQYVDGSEGSSSPCRQEYEQIKKIRARLEHAPTEELERIVKDYDSRSWPTKLFYVVFGDQARLEYRCAKAMLDGSFSWKQIAKSIRRSEIKIEQKKTESEKEEKYIALGKQVKRFDGNLQELESFTGERYRVLSARKVYDGQHQKLGKLGAEWLINTEEEGNGYKGTPVKKDPEPKVSAYR